MAQQGMFLTQDTEAADLKATIMALPSAEATNLLLLFNTCPASASSSHMDGYAQLYATTQPEPENLESPPLSSAGHGHNPPSSAATVRISSSSDTS